MSEKDIAKKRERSKSGKIYKQRRLRNGQMVKHVRNVKQRYLLKEEMKYFRARYFGLRLAKAREKLKKESVPPLRKSVWIKGKNGKPGYIREDPRLTRALTALKHQMRVTVPVDEDVNPEWGPFEKRKNITDYPLIQIHSDASDEEIEQDPAQEKPPTEVSLTTFFARSQLVGNQSGDESEFEPDGTQIIVKLEQKLDDSDIEELGHDDAQDPRPGPSTPMLTTSQRIQEGTDSSEEEEPPPKEVVEAAREMVTYRLVRELSANPDSATAMLQVLQKIKLNFPTDNGETKSCGIDFMKIDIPKNAKVRRKKDKGKGNGKKSTNHTDKPVKSGGNKKEVNKPKEEQNVGQDILELGLGPDTDIFSEQADKETDKVEPTMSKNKNKNYTKIPSEENPQKKQETKAPEGKKLTDKQKSPDKQKTSFFPPPNSGKAKCAKKEDHERQLNVHGLPNEFMGCTAGCTVVGAQDQALFQLFMKLSRRKAGRHGIDIRQDHIVGARPIIQLTSSGEEELVMRVTFDSKDTKA